MLRSRSPAGGNPLRTSLPISLIRQTDALPLLGVLRDAGASTEKLLQESELPESLEERGDGFIPFRSMLRFAGHAAGSQGIPDLCWRAVQHAPTDRLGGWGRAVSGCSTLRGAILTFCDYFRRDAPLMRLGLEVGDELAWFWRQRPAHVIGWLGDEEGQQFALGAMTRIVRAAAGPLWLPPRIQLESATAPWVSAIPELGACRIELQRPVVAIAIPSSLLDESTDWQEGDRRAERSEAPALADAAATLADSLQQAFASLLPAVHPSIEVAAEMAELGPRTLRRRLAQEGTSWRAVVDRARVEACLRLLRDPERPLSQVAAALGYSDQAHLTRAFRRWMGECPSAYRRRLHR